LIIRGGEGEPANRVQRAGYVTGSHVRSGGEAIPINLVVAVGAMSRKTFHLCVRGLLLDADRSRHVFAKCSGDFAAEAKKTGKSRHHNADDRNQANDTEAGKWPTLTTRRECNRIRSERAYSQGSLQDSLPAYNFNSIDSLCSIVTKITSGIEPRCCDENRCIGIKNGAEYSRQIVYEPAECQAGAPLAGRSARRCAQACLSAGMRMTRMKGDPP
jgi:hypothetical protein